jgi:hypothetical protein
MNHGLRYGQRMLTKQVSRPVDSLDPPSWPRRRSRSSELEERPGHGPDPRFLCLHPQGSHPRERASLERTVLAVTGLVAEAPRGCRTGRSSRSRSRRPSSPPATGRVSGRPPSIAGADSASPGGPGQIEVGPPVLVGSRHCGLFRLNGQKPTVIWALEVAPGRSKKILRTNRQKRQPRRPCAPVRGRTDSIAETDLRSLRRGPGVSCPHRQGLTPSANKLRSKY